MKKILICALAVGMFTACSQEETISTQAPTQISFDGAFVNNATRAAADPSITTDGTNGTTTALAGFDVWGFMDESTGVVFDDVTGGEDVTKANDAWTYTNTAYWIAGHTYYFAALAPMNSANIAKTPATGEAAKLGFGTITFTNKDGGEDLLYAAVKYDDLANVTTITSQPEPVKFAFNHLLSKVKFTFTNGFANETYKIDITKLTMKVAQNATIDLAVEDWWTNNEWENYTGETTLDFGTISQLTNAASQECAKERLTFPTDADQEYEVELEATLYLGTVEAKSIKKTIKISEIALKMGTAYNFIAELNANNFVSDDDPASQLYPITFDASVIEWAEGGDQEVSFAVSNEAQLKEAIATGGEFYLNKDITLTETMTITANTVLNFNGKKLTNAVDNANTDVIVVAEGATLTLEGEGNVTAVTGNDGYAVIAEGTVIINDGTYEAGKDANGEANAVIYARGKGQVYVNGGTFPNASNSAYVLNKKDADRATTTIQVTGGTFTNFNPGNNAAEGAGTNFLATGYESVDNGDGTFTVKKAE